MRYITAIFSIILFLQVPKLIALSVSTTELINTDYQTKLSTVLGSDTHFITQETYTYGPIKFQQLCRSFDLEGNPIGSKTLPLNEVLGGQNPKHPELFTISGPFHSMNAFFTQHAHKFSLLIKPSTVQGHASTGNFKVSTYPLDFKKTDTAFEFEATTNTLYDIGYIPETPHLYITTGYQAPPSQNQRELIPPQLQQMTIMTTPPKTLKLEDDIQFINWLSNGTRFITNQGHVFTLDGNIVATFNFKPGLKWNEKQIFSNPKSDIVYAVYPSGNAQIITAWNTTDDTRISFELNGLDKLYLSPDKSNFAQGYVSDDGQHFAIYDQGKCFLINLTNHSLYPLFYSLASHYNRYQFNTPIEDVTIDQSTGDVILIIRDLRNDRMENIELSIYNQFGLKQESFRLKKGHYYPIKNKKILQDLKYQSINLVELKTDS